MNWLRKHKTAIFITVVSGFIISTFVGFGLYVGTGSSAASGTVLVVNDEKIPYAKYVSLYNRVIENRREKGEELSPEALNGIKNDVVQTLVRESVFVQEAKRYGILVTAA